MATRPHAANFQKKILANWQLYLLILLPLIHLIIFRYGPMYGAQIAFRDYNPLIGFQGSEWVGLKHFTRFIDSPIFLKLMYSTLSLSLYSLIAGFPIPILLALGLNYINNHHFKKTVQMATYIPNFISVVVMVGLLIQMTDIRLGVINQILRFFGQDPVYFFGKPEYFRSLYVWSGIWQTAGWNSIIYLSSLSGVDPELHEAAIIDGATKVQRIRHIDIPGILPTAVILFIMSFGSFMNVGFEKAFLMQNFVEYQCIRDH